MTNTKYKQKIYAIIFIIISVLTIVFTPLSAFASTKNVDITTSSVRDDLASMGEDKLGYLSETTNSFIAMAQRYDSSNKLRTYVYLNYTGSIEDSLKICISISTRDDKNNITESYADYALKYVNNDSTWVKYEVLNLPNLDFVTRRYNIKGITSGATNILSMNETYIFHGLSNDSIEVLNQEVETITITEKEVAMICYGEEDKYYSFFGFDGLLGHDKKYTDVWYIFFNTDKPMDELLEIEITYKPFDYEIEQLGVVQMRDPLTEEEVRNYEEQEEKLFEWNINYGEQERVIVTPGTTKVSATTNWWGAYETKYENVDNIMDLRTYEAQSTEDNPFVFTEQAKKYTWGVNFLNTEKASERYTALMLGTNVEVTKIDGTSVCNTAILRLKYARNGIVKNAYAVDVPTDDVKGYDAQIDFTSFEDIFERIISIIMLLVLVVLIVNVCAPVLLPLFNLLDKAISGLISLIVIIIRLPFKLLFGRKRK